jgi:hypothetical protein
MENLTAYIPQRASSTCTIQARGWLIILTMKDNKTIEIVFLKNDGHEQWSFLFLESQSQNMVAKVFTLGMQVATTWKIQGELRPVSSEGCGSRRRTSTVWVNALRRTFSLYFSASCIAINPNCFFYIKNNSNFLPNWCKSCYNRVVKSQTSLAVSRLP